MDPMVWIVVGVIAVLVVIALIALAVRQNNRKKLTEAAALRRDAGRREEQLERQHAVAREHEHRAGAAEQEAKAKAAEADRIRAEAERHRTAVDEQKRDVRRMEQHAEKLDPRHRAEDPSGHVGGEDAGARKVGRHAAPDDASTRTGQERVDGATHAGQDPEGGAAPRHADPREPRS